MVALIGKFIVLLLTIVVVVGLLAGQIIKDIYAMRAPGKSELNDLPEG